MMWPVSTRVNTPKNDDADLLAPQAEADAYAPPGRQQRVNEKARREAGLSTPSCEVLRATPHERLA